MDIVWSIVVVILMLGVLVTIHELGHFWVASLLGIKAYEVSIFVGPKLIHWTRNGVEYSIRAIPLGAYVRFTDLDEEGNVIESDDPSLLINNPRWKRLIVALAGPFMNVLLGVIIFMGLYCWTGFQSLDINYAPNGSQLAQTDYVPGDTVVKVNGKYVYTAMDFFVDTQMIIPETEPVTLTIKSRQTGDLYDVELVPELTTRPMLGITCYQDTDNKYNGWEIVSSYDSQNNGNPILKSGDYLVTVEGKSVADPDFLEYLDTLAEGDTMTYGFYRNGEYMEEECIISLTTFANDRGVYLLAYRVSDLKSFMRGLGYACKMPLTTFNITVKSLSLVFSGEEEVYNMVSGPVGVTVAVSDVVGDVDDTFVQKTKTLIMMAGLISIGLMITNLLPIPGLDGNQIVLILIEMVIGRKISKKAEDAINVVGFFALIALVLFAFASDIIRIFME
ncbi:MAG: RIP metalloprotease RseP [Saccharofermentans sp.]|nr:RIP metalloprotease RseP [Saccharofermentans sp.]